MVKFIFEDNIVTPSSRLLKECRNGDNIYFTGGNSSIKSTLESVYNKNDVFVIFLDVSPNNSALLSRYEELRVEFDKYRGNVVILPIFCIEYYIIDLLNELNLLNLVSKGSQPLVDNIYFNQSWKDVPEEYKTKSVEKLCKQVLNDIKPLCLRNKGMDKNGEFYVYNCSDCKAKRCRQDLNIDLKFKSELFYTRLPIFDTVDSSHETYLHDIGIEFKDCTFDEAKNKLQLLYNSIGSCDGKSITVT